MGDRGSTPLTPVNGHPGSSTNSPTVNRRDVSLAYC